MQFTFNVIYTPGTVATLRYFVPTLIRHTRARFRLVANGCSAREQHQLARLALTSDQLEYHLFPSRKIRNHGIVITHLLQLEDGDLFCFMDSDIFATGDFVAELGPHLEGQAAFFSGRPIWSNATDQVAARGVRFCGPHNQSESGVTVGSTYFAIYRRPELLDVIEWSGLNFEKVTAFLDIPERLQHALEELGCRTDTYEVGKLLNLLLQIRGASIRYHDLDTLRHVGGLSLLAKKRIDKQPYINVDGDQASLPRDYSAKIRPWMPRKRFTCHYLSETISAALEGHSHQGPLLVDEPEVREQVLTTARQLIQICDENREFFQRLDGAGRLKTRWKRIRRALFGNYKPLTTEGVYLLGMHRSGTSCLTGLLETSGLWIGNAPRQSNWNAKGNLEDVDVRVLNEQVLERFGGSWRQPVEDLPARAVKPDRVLEVLKAYRRQPRWIIKDPRLLFTLGLWLPHTPNYRFAGTFRHPLAVARSLQRRNDMPLPEGIKLWELYNRMLVTLHRQRGFPLINFDLGGHAYLSQFEALCRELELPYNAGAVQEFYEARLINQQPEAGDSLTGESAELHAYLLEHQLRSDSLPPAGPRQKA